MAFNINDFKASTEKYGYLQPSKFDVIITPPPVVPAPPGDLMVMRAERVNIPGINLMTNGVNRYGIGPKQDFPTNVTFPETSITFVSDMSGQIYTFWHTWLNTIFNFVGADNTQPMYQLQYKSQYSTVITVNMYDMYGKIQKIFNLNDAYPSYIREVPLDWNFQNKLTKIDIGITYKDMTIVGQTAPATGATQNAPTTAGALTTTAVGATAVTPAGNFSGQ